MLFTIASNQSLKRRQHCITRGYSHKSMVLKFLNPSDWSGKNTGPSSTSLVEMRIFSACIAWSSLATRYVRRCRGLKPDSSSPTGPSALKGFHSLPVIAASRSASNITLFFGVAPPSAAITDPRGSQCTWSARSRESATKGLKATSSVLRSLVFASDHGRVGAASSTCSWRIFSSLEAFCMASGVIFSGTTATTCNRSMSPAFSPTLPSSVEVVAFSN
mmetsp:Transcript_83864/g.234023  ORF Transcript_83864/g.234023 Transcript_83864/m.234023 type:complete len:218 (+) Transcript_83864:1420-2073(+)